MPEHDAKLALLVTDAERGVARAQRHLANRYLRGRGVACDAVLGALWMRRAAEQGLALAQRDLAALFEQGLGVRQDAGEARRWYEKAAAQGDALAQRRLRQMKQGAE